MQLERDALSLALFVESPTLLYSPPNHLTSGGYPVGKIEDRSAQILQTFHEDTLINMQIVLTTARPSIKKRQKRCFGQPQRLETFSVILYGPELMAGDIGKFCQDSHIYLQDPHDCDRNVAYYNPHCLSPLQGQRRMTLDLHRHNTDAVVTEIRHKDTLDALLTPRWLGELDTPSGLRSNLFLYVISSLHVPSYAHELQASATGSLLHGTTRAWLGSRIHFLRPVDGT
jgi:hypothetical protein